MYKSMSPGGREPEIPPVRAQELRRSEAAAEAPVLAATGLSLAMVYGVEQRFGSVYEPDVGLQRGTIFPELDKPWLGEEAVRGE